MQADLINMPFTRLNRLARKIPNAASTWLEGVTGVQNDGWPDLDYFNFTQL